MPVCTTTRAHDAVNKVVDVPVIMRGEVSAPDSVHRQKWWTFQLAPETGTRLSAVAVYGGGRGFLAALTHFSRSSGLSWS